MNWLLDTCVISELVKPRPDPKTVAWLDGCDEARLCLSVLTIGELQKGISKLADGPKKRELQGWVDHDLASRFAGRILVVDANVAAAWGEMQGNAERNGECLPAIDSLLAATAQVHDLIIATRNVRDLERCGAQVFNPWESE